MSFRTLARWLAWCGVLGAAGCTPGTSATAPPTQTTNLATAGKLQFVVGTANIATGGTAFVGLNTVVTFRGATGATAFAVNTPQIVGPPGFKVPPVGSAGSDAGTNTIDSAPQGASPVTPPTFSSSNQATAYGFAPDNYTVDGTQPVADYSLPIYYDELANGSTPFPAFPFYGFPPAFSPNPTGVAGYNPGFVYFAATPVSGAYALNVAIPTAAGSSQVGYTYRASATLNAAKVLPPLAAPAYADDGAGGGTIAVPTFPAGVTSEIVEISDQVSGSAETFAPVGPGPLTVADGTLTPGDGYVVLAAGFDYNWIAPAPPANLEQTPSLPAQADITVAVPTAGTATGATPAARTRRSSGGKAPWRGR